MNIEEASRHLQQVEIDFFTPLDGINYKKGAATEELKKKRKADLNLVAYCRKKTEELEAVFNSFF